MSMFKRNKKKKNDDNKHALGKTSLFSFSKKSKKSKKEDSMELPPGSPINNAVIIPEDYDDDNGNELASMDTSNNNNTNSNINSNNNSNTNDDNGNDDIIPSEHETKGWEMEVPIYDAEGADETKFVSQLETMENMGFSDKQQNLNFLMRFNGNVQMAISRIVFENERAKKQRELSMYQPGGSKVKSNEISNNDNDNKDDNNDELNDEIVIENKINENKDNNDDNNDNNSGNGNNNSDNINSNDNSDNMDNNNDSKDNDSKDNDSEIKKDENEVNSGDQLPESSDQKNMDKNSNNDEKNENIDNIENIQSNDMESEILNENKNSNNENNDNTDTKEENVAKTSKINENISAEVRKWVEMDENSCCMECGKPDVAWASINLGITLCDECAGLHRQVGVHISKVRSLWLDDIWKKQPELITDLINNYGNKKARNKYQHNIPAFVVNPKLDGISSTVIINWIIDKYDNKLFYNSELDKKDNENKDDTKNNNNNTRVNTICQMPIESFNEYFEWEVPIGKSKGKKYKHFIILYGRYISRYSKSSSQIAQQILDITNIDNNIRIIDSKQNGDTIIQIGKENSLNGMKLFTKDHKQAVRLIENVRKSVLFYKYIAKNLYRYTNDKMITFDFKINKNDIINKDKFDILGFASKRKNKISISWAKRFWVINKQEKLLIYFDYNPINPSKKKIKMLTTYVASGGFKLNEIYFEIDTNGNRLGINTILLIYYYDKTVFLKFNNIGELMKFWQTLSKYQVKMNVNFKNCLKYNLYDYTQNEYPFLEENIIKKNQNNADLEIIKMKNYGNFELNTELTRNTSNDPTSDESVGSVATNHTIVLHASMPVSNTSIQSDITDDNVKTDDNKDDNKNDLEERKANFLDAIGINGAINEDHSIDHEPSNSNEIRAATERERQQTLGQDSLDNVVSNLSINTDSPKVIKNGGLVPSVTPVDQPTTPKLNQSITEALNDNEVMSDENDEEIRESNEVWSRERSKSVGKSSTQIMRQKIHERRLANGFYKTLARIERLKKERRENLKNSKEVTKQAFNFGSNDVEFSNTKSISSNSNMTDNSKSGSRFSSKSRNKKK